LRCSQITSSVCDLHVFSSSSQLDRRLLPDDLWLQKINPRVVAGPAWPAVLKIDVLHNCSRRQGRLCPRQPAPSTFRGHSPTMFSNAATTTPSARLRSRRRPLQQLSTTTVLPAASQHRSPRQLPASKINSSSDLQRHITDFPRLITDLFGVSSPPRRPSLH
jgi:hypothetical protein